MSETGNQQAKVSQWELGWLAGMVDGEGTIRFNIGPHRRGAQAHLERQRMPVVQIAGTNPTGMEFIHDLLNRMGIGHHITWSRNRNPNWKDAWLVKSYGFGRSRAFLEAIEGFLVIKKPHSDLMLEYLRRKMDAATPTKHQRISDYERDVWEKMAALNRKGN